MEAIVQNTCICTCVYTFMLGKKTQMIGFLVVRLKRPKAQGKFGFAFMASRRH